MENVVIKNVGMANQKTIMPIIGEITVDEFGEITVPEDLAELLIGSNIGWSSKNEIKLEEEIVDNASIDELTATVKAMSTIELVDMAQKSGFPEDEWLKFSQNKKSSTMLMQVYILKKLKEQENLKETDSTEEVSDPAAETGIVSEETDKEEKTENPV